MTPELQRPERALSSFPARLVQLSTLFLKLEVISFGGPAAHIALIEEKSSASAWVTRQQFLDLSGAAPGPISTELAINVGFVRAGCAGLCVAGACWPRSADSDSLRVLPSFHSEEKP